MKEYIITFFLYHIRLYIFIVSALYMFIFKALKKQYIIVDQQQKLILDCLV